MLFIRNPPHGEQTKYERAAFVTVYLSRAVHICTIYVNSYCNIKTSWFRHLNCIKKSEIKCYNCSVLAQ